MHDLEVALAASIAIVGLTPGLTRFFRNYLARILDPGERMGVGSCHDDQRCTQQDLDNRNEIAGSHLVSDPVGLQ